MARFFIEVPHEASQLSCLRAVEVFLKTGSHFFTHASWGCRDGEHKAWLIMDVESKDAARALVPPAYRALAKVVQLNDFTTDEIQNYLSHYKT